MAVGKEGGCGRGGWLGGGGWMSWRVAVVEEGGWLWWTVVVEGGWLWWRVGLRGVAIGAEWVDGHGRE